MAAPTEDQTAAITAAVAGLKTALIAKFAEKEAKVVEAEKKLQDAVSSAISSDAFKAFSDALVADLADIKGIMG